MVEVGIPFLSSFLCGESEQEFFRMRVKKKNEKMCGQNSLKESEFDS